MIQNMEIQCGTSYAVYITNYLNLGFTNDTVWGERQGVTGERVYYWPGP